VAIFSLALFLLRLYWFTSVSPVDAIIVAMVIIMVHHIEIQVSEYIENPSTFISVASFFKILKAAFSAAILTVNNDINDFFVAYFFFVTSLCGIIYLSIAGYEFPKGTGSSEFNSLKFRSVK